MQCRGFLAIPRFNHIRCAVRLQLPHMVFIFFIPKSSTLTFIMLSHLETSARTSSFNRCLYLSSKISPVLSVVVPGPGQLVSPDDEFRTMVCPDGFPTIYSFQMTPGKPSSKTLFSIAIKT